MATTTTAVPLGGLPPPVAVHVAEPLPVPSYGYGPSVRHTMSLSEWLLKKARATILDNIASHVLALTLWATMITCINQLTTADLTVSNQLLTVLGTVLGFVVSWRSSSAYDKYKEGIKLWSQIVLGSRNLASQIWFHVKDAEPGEVGQIKTTIEKRSMLNLIIGFSTSVKHYLRGESGIYYDDLYPYIAHLPRSSFPTDPLGVDPTNPHQYHVMPLFQNDARHRHEASRSTSLSRALTKNNNDLVSDQTPTVRSTGTQPRLPLLRNRGTADSSYDMEAGKEGGSGTITPGVGGRRGRMGMVDDDPPLVPGYNPPKSDIYDWIPPLILIRPFIKFFFGTSDDRWRPGSKRRRQLGESNVPLEILLYISSYIAHVTQAKRCEAPMLTILMTSLGTLQDALANLERVLTSPVPVAYQFHLRFTVWTYLLLLPFQVFKAFGWITIPATTVASIIYLGFVEIGTEIENPFGFDANDLDLDWYAVVIRKELAEIAAHPPPDPASFIFTHSNRPFWPADERCAQDLVAAATQEQQDPSKAFTAQTLRSTLNRQFREVSRIMQ